MENKNNRNYERRDDYEEVRPEWLRVLGVFCCWNSKEGTVALLSWLFAEQHERLLEEKNEHGLNE